MIFAAIVRDRHISGLPIEQFRFPALATLAILQRFRTVCADCVVVVVALLAPSQCRLSNGSLFALFVVGQHQIPMLPHGHTLQNVVVLAEFPERFRPFHNVPVLTVDGAIVEIGAVVIGQIAVAVRTIVRLTVNVAHG